MCSPSPPPPPDYAGAAREQGVANVEAARTQGRINNPNVINPYGRQTVTWEGETPTINQELSPGEQAVYEANLRNRQGMGSLAGQGLESLRGLIGTGIDFSGAPGYGSAFTPGYSPEVFNPEMLGPTPEVYSRSEGLPELPQASEAIRGRVIDAMMSRADEDFGRRRQELDGDLIARGLRPGTEAYERERSNLERARNDYRSQAELTGGAEAQRAFEQDRARRQMAYGENLTDATTRFGQQEAIRRARTGEQAQRFAQQGQSEELRMRGQNQRFTQQDAARRQAITEILARRQLPLNEITALMSGSQVSNPFSMPGYAQNTQVAPPPLFAGQQAAGQQANNVYNAQVGTSNANTAAAGSLAAAAMMFF